MKTICSLSILLFPMFLLGQGTPSFSQTDSGAVCLGTTVTFTNTSTGGLSYEWKVNGIFFDSTQTINYTFADTGQFRITLVVSDSGGTDSAIANFLVPSLPTTDPIVSGETCEDFQDGSISLMTSGGIPPYSFLWSTGDSTGDISGLAPGEYSVTITDSIGCQSVDTMVVENVGTVVAGFTFQSEYLSLSVDFTDKSINAVSWFWSFGDLGTDTVQNPTHVYVFPGSYDVVLIATSLWGCKDTFIVEYINPGRISISDDILHPLTILPNPATTQISLDLTSWLGREVTIQILDITGRVVQNTHLQAQTQIDLDISELATGIYSVLVEIDGKYLVGRLKKE